MFERTNRAVAVFIIPDSYRYEQGQRGWLYERRKGKAEKVAVVVLILKIQLTMFVMGV